MTYSLARKITKTHTRHQSDAIVPRGDNSFATKRELVEILEFRHFAKHIVFTCEGEMCRNKYIKDKATFKKCAEIGNRLIGKTTTVKAPTQNTTQVKPIKLVIDYDKYLNELKNLTDFPDTPQARGFAFERYLHSLFEINGLKPRGSFKLVGEQIDGSFLLHNEVYLLEAKWTSKKIDKGDLVIFNEKVSLKSGFTRGLYISFSGYSDEALATFANGRTVNIVLMTVQELTIALTRKVDLTNVLKLKVRALAEEGNYNKSVLEILFKDAEIIRVLHPVFYYS